MERHPKRSRAFLIALIVVIVLLIVGYFLFRNSTTTQDPSGTTNGGNKLFSSLFSSSKKKTTTQTQEEELMQNTDNLEQNPQTPGAGSVDENGNFIPVSNLGNTGTTGTGSTVGGGGNLTAPTANPIPAPTNTTPSSPNTTTQGTGGTTVTTTGTGGGNTGTPIVVLGSTTPSSICPINDPLIFTDTEKAELETLLRQYYLIAPSLKTNDDVSLVKNEMSNYISLIDQANTLTNQCTAQKAAVGYTGPQTIKGNPYYQQGIGSPTYLPGQISAWIQSHTTSIADYTDFEQTFNIW